MSDIPICLDNDHESDISFTTKMGVSPDSQSPPLSHDHIGHKFVSLTNDFVPERVSGNSFNEIAFSLNSFEDHL